MNEVPEEFQASEIESENQPASQAILAVRVRAFDRNHKHNGRPTHGQPFRATLEAANALLANDLATIEE